MIQSVTVINYVGDELEISLADPWSSGFAITNIDGIAATDASINTTDVATNDGTIYNSARVNSRNIVFTFKLLPNPTIEEQRLKVYKYFPIKKEITLRFKTDTRYVQIVGYVESSDTNVFSNLETTQVSILCPDPYFEDVRPQVIDFSGISPLFEFPFVNDEMEDHFAISELLQDTARTVFYTGDIENGMEIDIHAIGPASNLTIYNIDTRESMGIIMNLEPLDDIIITTMRNKKSAKLLRHGLYSNILNKLSKNSDWFKLRKGDNVISYVAETGVENLQFSITTKVLYEGI